MRRPLLLRSKATEGAPQADENKDNKDVTPNEEEKEEDKVYF